MKFTSGARVREAVFTIVPSRKVVLPDMTTQWSQPLRAEFRNHKFDSVKAQAQHGWTDEQRVMVEEGLMKNRRFNQAGGRGLYIDKTATRVAAVATAEADATAAAEGRALRCQHYSDDENGVTVQCPEKVDTEFPDFDLCVKHREDLQEQLTAVGSAPATE